MDLEGLIWDSVFPPVIYLLKWKLEDVWFDPTDLFEEATWIKVREFWHTVQLYLDVRLTVIVLGVPISPPLSADKCKVQT
jgi:hypothetical protein